MRLRFYAGRWWMQFGWAACLGGLLATGLTPSATAQVDDPGELSEEEQRQVQIAERFVTVLERSPRRGTALDRVYGHHVEFGTLDQFVESLRQRVAQQADDGIGWMLLGLVESQRGEDANAIDAFRKAEEHRPEDAMASYYLGQSLLLLGQPEQAVEAFERAIERNPPRQDLLEIFQQLGRVHQRAQREEEALAVWSRLEQLFPDDPRVQEQIAVTLVEEGEYELALPRYEKLAELVTDDYRQTMFRLEAAELKVRDSRKEEGIADLEEVLANLNPDSWLHRDVRRRIEDIFLRSGDQDGLVKYYERWIEKHAEDVDAMARVAKHLSASARMPEAMKWMERAIQLAPGRFELRKSFIDQLVDDQRYADAVQQYELLATADPGNPDVLRDWGKLVLKDKSQPIEQRQAQAQEIWKQIIANRPDDALTISQVADLFRQSNLNDEAIALYQQAVALAPGDPQYREYLGEFFHILKRSDEALATWREIAAGDRHTAVNVARLAEVYNTFGYMPAAVEEIAEACRLETKDFALQLRAADYHTRAEKYDEALAFVAAASALAANGEERDAVIAQRIEVLQASRRLEAESDALAARLASPGEATTDDWHLLARYYEAERRWAAASEAIDKAIELDAKSIPALTTAARIAESSGNLGRAADLNRNLADVDRRARGDHLMNVARLKAQLGQTKDALQAGRDLIVSAPGNTDNYEFYAQLCFQLGEMDEGLDALRKAVRINPTEPSLIMSLGAALSQQVRVDEAIEVYWRAFERTEEIEEKTTLTEKLTALYLQLNQFDKLIERFERDRREEDQRRDMTICLAQAHHSAGDYGTARAELESLLSQETRDTNLLQQLSKLCEGGSDLDGAIEYQRQLAAIAPGHETEFRLAGLLQRSGYTDEATQIFVKLTRREEDPVRLVASIDSLLKQGSYESVLSIVEPMLSEQRDDWELMYRQGVAWASLDKEAEARDVFQRIATLSTPYEQYGRAAEEKFKRDQAKSKSNNLRGIRSQGPQRMTPLEMLGQSYQVKQAAGLEADRGYYNQSNQLPNVWTPDVYGVARMAAYGWQMKFERQQERKTSDAPEPEASFIDAIAARAAADDAPRDAIYDWMFIEQLRGNYKSLFEVARRLAREGGREEQSYYLQSLMTRTVDAASARASSNGQEQPQVEPLAEEDLELMLSCYRSLVEDDELKGEAAAAFLGGQVAYSSNGQMYVNVGGNWVMVSGGGSYAGDRFLTTVVTELERAGREAEGQELIETRITAAESASELAGAVGLLLGRWEKRPEPERLQSLYDRWVVAARGEITNPPESLVSRMSRMQSQVYDPLSVNSQLIVNWFGQLGPEEEHQQMLDILDPALDLAVEVAKAKRLERSKLRRRTSSTSSRQNAWGMQYQFGKSSQYVQISYPSPSDYVSQSQLTLLRATYEIFKRNDVPDDLAAALERRVGEASDDDRVYEQLMHAYVLWWADRQDEALEVLTKAGESLQDDPQFRLELAEVYTTQGDLDTAMDLVETITPRDQKLLQQREMMAMTLAERLGEIDRARQAAERLFGLRLSTNEQLALGTTMRRLGLMDLSDAMLARAQQRSGNQASSWPLLMAQYQGQGKTELAQQLAHRILQTTQSPLTGMSLSSRNPTRYSNNSDNGRQQALRVLQQTGGLQPLIDRLEGQLAGSPESPRLYEQLIELYQATNNRDKLGETLERAVTARPDAAALQLQLAKHYEQTNKPKQACDAYLAVLKVRPQWIADDLYQIRRVFERAERSLDLAKAFEDMDLRQLGHPYYLIDIVSSLMSSEENLDIAANLFERIVDDFPTYRNQMVSRMHDGKIWKNERIYELGKRMIIPTPEEVVTTPWFGINDVYSYSTGGTAQAMFHRMRDGVFQAGRLDDFEKTIREATDQLPGWRGGRAMLALIALKRNKQAEARGMLEALVSDEEVVQTMPTDACWLIGQELDDYQETRPLALKLFEQGVSEDVSRNQIQYSPIVRLIKIYTEVGRKDDARDILLKNLKPKSIDYYDQDYQLAMLVQNKFWAAEQFAAMGYPLDALTLYQELSGEDSSLSRAASWNGDSVEGLKRRIATGLNSSIEAVSQTDPDAAMSQLLAVPEELTPGQPVFDLMLSVNPIDAGEYEEMSSRFIKVLQAVSSGEAVAASLQSRLAELQTTHPGDVSIAVTRALLADGEQRTAAVQQLRAVLDDHPLEQIPDGRRPNARQRREAQVWLPVWMVARTCLQDPELRESGRWLGERALTAAERQIGDTQTAVILMEWGQTAITSGDKAEAERRWSQLLDVATRRPTRKKPEPKRTTSRLVPAGRGVWGEADPVVFWDDAAAAPAPEVLPPLTVSQFELATEVAIRAAEHGLPALSRRAVREMLAGGSPVPDVSTSTTPSSSGMFVAAAAASSAAPSAGETNKTERLVASSLLRVVGKWTGPDYPAAEVYELLLPVVLPPARPQEVLLYPDSSQLEQAVVSNAGSVVVDWAAKAGQLEELDRQIVARMPENGFDIPARVIRIEIAIARDDLEGAKAQLEQLADKLLQGLSDSTATLACHAALPATDHPELREPAYRILRTTVKLRAQAAAADRNSNVSIGPLQRKVIRYQSRQGDESEVAAFFEEYLVGRQSYYSRYSGNSGLYRQWSDWASLADEAIQVGALTTALDYLGRTVDFELENYGRPGTREAFAGVLREMQSLPAEERYLRWRDWSLPTEGRRTVRVVVQPLRPNRTPPEFLPADGQALDFLQQDFHSNLYSLLDAAEECGKLDELRGLAEKAVGEKVQNAEFLWPLVLIRMQDLEAVTPVLDQLAATMKERNEPKEGQPRVDIGRDYLVYHAALQRPETAALYMKHRTKLRDQLRNRGGSQYLPRLDADFARARLREMNGSLEPGDDPGLVYWSPATTDTLPSDGIRPWWAVSGPQLVHLGGSGSDSLYFRVPLTGNFEFSVDCVEHNWTESDIGYNGVIVNAQSWGSEMEVTAVDGHESFRQPQPLKRSRPALNRAAVKVQDGTMSYWLNNQQVYSEPISATSPWLHLNTDRPRHASFWNLTLTGEPTIPASVALIDGNRMDGWNTRYFNESQPRHRIMAQKLTSDSHYQLRRDQEREPAEHDWSVQEGVLRARAERSGPEHGQSWAYYHRPLAAGETFAYEFLYRPGQSVAHPTLGRMAYLLNPQGVTTHWIVDRQWDQSLLGIPVENEHVPADGRRGPEALPLRAGEWNAVAVTFDGTNVQIALNGQPVYDAPAVVEPDTRFGLYRLKRQGLEVREAMLTGPWREQFDSLQDLDLLALQQPVDRPTERLLSQLTVEQYSVLDVRRILEVARRSSPERAYDQLVGWVLPSESHPNIRLYFEDSIGGSAADGADPMSQGSSLQVGPVECPAVELIHLALQLGRLEELARAVATVKTFNPPQVRAQQAMSALIAVAAGEDETALEVMRVFDGNLAGSFESNAQSFFIAPEVMVIRAAAHRPRLALAAYQLSQRLVEDARDKKRSSDWQEEASILRGYTETLLARHRELDSPGRSQLTQWSVVPYLKPQDRATGRRPSSWTYRRGSVTHDAGDTWGQLFFQSPLRGKFEIVADRSLYGYREVALSYGLHAAAPSYDLKAIDVTTVMHGNRQVKPLPKLPQLGWKSEFRIQVDGAKISTSVAGQALHEETLAKPPAPWIMLQAHTPQSLSFVHNLRILGEPEIPDELDLLESWNLGLWRGDYYLGSLSSDGSDENAAWRPVGDELFGNLRQDRTIAHRESLVAYQRPMLEDGTIRYEFFYVPGEFEVHPVVGQSAFLLSSDGVMRHELTNAEYEADGRAPNNAAPLSGPAVQPSLKPDDWNLVQLSLAGNRLTISVNEVEVAQVDVPEPNSERFFGLFRYANLTKARVRSIRYRGNWPKSLPAVADQELAIPPDGFLPQPDSHWTSERKIDLTQLPPENGGGDFVLANGALVAEPTPQGLRLHIDNAGGRKTSPTLGANVRAVGDCELTVDFDQLHLTPVTGGWGNALSLKFHLTDSGESYTELALMLNGDGKPNFKVAHQHKRLNGQGRHDQLGMPESYASGRLRFVRLGGTVYGLYAPQGTSDYRCVATAPVGTGPIRRVEIAGISSDNQAVVDFVLTDVTLKTREISAALTRADE